MAKIDQCYCSGHQWRNAHWVGLVQKLSHGLSPRKLENVKNAG
jgi:hypothetical protein